METLFLSIWIFSNCWIDVDRHRCVFQGIDMKKKSNTVKIDFGDGKEEVEYTELIFFFILVVLVLMSSYVLLYKIWMMIL